MTDPLPDDQRLLEISSKAYEHPADRAATAALQSIPMLDQVVRKLIEFARRSRGWTSRSCRSSTSRSSRSPTPRRSAPSARWS
jgi:hypothetical protein